LAAGLSGVGSSSLPLAGASVAVAADENAYGFTSPVKPHMTESVPPRSPTVARRRGTAHIGVVELVLYDGVCGLCNRTVRYILDRDRTDRFRYGSLQGPLAARTLAKYGKDPKDLDTFYLLLDYGTDRERMLCRGRAALKVLTLLGGWRVLLGVFAILPDSLLDVAYRFVARNRYRWFGRLDACRLPNEGDAAKFLDGSFAPS